MTGTKNDLFDFQEEKVTPYLKPVNEFILMIENMIKK